MTSEDLIPGIDLSAEAWLDVHRILRQHVPHLEVWAFGSRARWTAKKYSDLDLAVLTDKPLPPATAADLRTAFDESTLPIKVDVVDWSTISDSFRKIIEADKVVVQTPLVSPCSG